MMKKLILATLLALGVSTANAQIQQFPIAGPSLIDGNHLNLMVNAINGLTGQGGTPSKGYFSLNTGTGPTTLTGSIVQAVGANAASARVEIDAYGGAGIFSAVRRDGTKASPTAVLSTEQIGSFNFHGASTTALVYGPAARYTAYATENWSSTAGGTKLVLSVTPNTTQTITDAVTINQDSGTVVTSASATAFAVGRLGSTTPALLVDASTSTSITGIKIKSAASTGGVALSAIGEASNGALTIDAQGSGTITLAGTSTGNVVLSRAATGVSFSGTGLVTSRSGTATPAAASAVASYCMGSSSVCIYWGTGSPNTALTAAKGSLYIATDGSSSSTRMFVNTDGSTAWAAVTTAS